jgi:death-on-curing protein
LPSGSRHYRITIDDAIEANRYAIAFGGLPGVKRIDDLRSAIGRPYHGYHRPIQRKAAALFQSIAGSQCFNDGNKRSAVLLVDLLLEKSGYRLRPVDPETYEAFAVHVAEDHPAFDGIVDWFRARIERATLTLCP